MIGLLTEDQMPVFEKLTARDPFGVRIAADYRGYGTAGPINNMVWLQDACAAVSLRGDVAVLCGNVGDTAEMKAFLSFISPENLVCGLDTAERLGLKILQHGDVMRKDTQGACREISADYSVCVKSAAALLYDCGMDFDSVGFFAEVSHALHRGIGTVETLYEADKLCACAVSVNISGDSALINGVAVDKACRGRGYGTEIMNQIGSLLAGRTLFIYKETGRYGAFYEKLGFEYSGRWAVGKLEGK